MPTLIAAPTTRRDDAVIQSLRWAANATAVCVALIVVWVATESAAQAETMAVNLGLAWIPVAAAAAGATLVRHGRHGPWLIPVGVVWLIFLPNAPYLATDIVHVHEFTSSSPLVIPAALAALAITGLILLWAAVTVAGDVARRAGLRPAKTLLVPACMVASAIGIYVGRVLRWNSWDLLTRPGSRFHDAARELSAPGAAMHAIAVTGIAMALCWAAYGLVARLARVRRT